MEEKFYYRLILKKDTTANWAISTYVPLESEPCYDTDLKEFKIGNGVDLFVDLAVVGGGAGVALELVTDTTNFDGLLSPSDTDVQKALDTLDNLVIPVSSGLIRHSDDAFNYGWAFQCKLDNPTSYGNIGKGAVDFSASLNIGTYGATGAHSLASGFHTTASGRNSIAFGTGTISSGTGSVALGGDTTASANRAFTQGADTIASGENSAAFGSTTKAINTSSLAMGKYNVGTALDTILEVGIGVWNAEQNALEIYTDGRVIAPSLTTIVDAKSLVTKEYADTKIASDVTQAGAGSIAVSNFVKITQANYDLITPDADTFYAIIAEQVS